MTKPVCRHCCVNKKAQARGLCTRCYRTPAVKAAYAPQPGHTTTGFGIGLAASKPASAPCPHPRGSDERLATLTRRAERGEAMAHPGDSREIDPAALNRAGHTA